jgi:hypothetical protein
MGGYINISKEANSSTVCAKVNISIPWTDADAAVAASGL